MKKIILLLVALFTLSLAEGYAQSKALEKARKKEYKTKIKEFEKEGYKVFGTSRSLEMALLLHYEKLDKMGDDGQEIVGIASAFKSKNTGHQMALNSALINYATKASSQLQGRTVSDVHGEGVAAEGEFDKFYGAYQNHLQAEIKGALSESFSVIKDNHNGTYEMQTYFVFSENAASKARLRALENAAKETAAAQEYARKISDFINEPVKID